MNSAVYDCLVILPFGSMGPPFGSMVGLLSLLCLCSYSYGFLSGGQRAAWNLAYLFNYSPGCASPIVKVKSQRSRSPQGQKTHCALTNPRGIDGMVCAHWKYHHAVSRRDDSVATEGWLRRPACKRLGGQSELGGICILLANTLVCKFCCISSFLVFPFHLHCSRPSLQVTSCSILAYIKNNYHWSECLCVWICREIHCGVPEWLRQILMLFLTFIQGVLYTVLHIIM